MSVLGFLFWLSVAHLYTPEQIGSASALIAATTLLGNASLLGMEYSLIRFLPKSKNQSKDINAAIGFVAIAAIVAALGVKVPVALLPLLVKVPVPDAVH